MKADVVQESWIDKGKGEIGHPRQLDQTVHLEKEIDSQHHGEIKKYRRFYIWLTTANIGTFLLDFGIIVQFYQHRFIETCQYLVPTSVMDYNERYTEMS